MVLPTAPYQRVIFLSYRPFCCRCLSSVHLAKEHIDTHNILPPNTAGSLSAFSLFFLPPLKNCDMAIKLSAHKLMMERHAGETAHSAIKNMSLLGMCSLYDDVLLAGSNFMAVSGLYKHIKLWIILENRISRLNAFCWWNLHLTLFSFLFSGVELLKTFFRLKLMWLCVLKVIVNSKTRILSLFTHLHIITNECFE